MRLRARGSLSMLTSRMIAIDKTVAEQRPLDAFDRAADARIGRRQKTDERNHEQAGVGFFAAVILHEAIVLLAEAALAHFGMNVISHFFPARGIAGQAKLARSPLRCDRRRPRPSLSNV